MRSLLRKRGLCSLIPGEAGIEGNDSSRVPAVTDPAAHAKRCLICGKAAEAQWRPFCSKRCADVDLNRWLSGVYAAPVVEDEDEVSTVPKSADEAG